eukprot:5658005-Pleurochrysis_carterae.AAC.1
MPSAAVQRFYLDLIMDKLHLQRWTADKARMISDKFKFAAVSSIASKRQNADTSPVASRFHI